MGRNTDSICEICVICVLIFMPDSAQSGIDTDNCLLFTSSMGQMNLLAQLRMGGL